MLLEYDCYMEEDGRDYSGQINTTVSGLTCQAWRSQFPHQHTRTNIDNFPGERACDFIILVLLAVQFIPLLIHAILFLDTKLEDARNYCRNPDRENGPWCYTVDRKVRWQMCDVKRCDCKCAFKFTSNGNIIPARIQKH